jgi:phosphatidylserine/phosphatidylglycerophosphate/cardiolipin synthase-like enzyme
MSETYGKNELIVNGDYSEKLVPYIDLAKISIDILMYDWRWYKQDFSCDVSLVNNALIRAVRRGVKVRAVVNTNTVIEQLNALGIVAKGWKKSKAMHAKCFILDHTAVMIGSHNLTQNAMGFNVEISAIFSDIQIADELTKYFNSLWLL